MTEGSILRKKTIAIQLDFFELSGRLLIQEYLESFTKENNCLEIL